MSTQSAKVIDFAAFRARRAANSGQPSLLDVAERAPESAAPFGEQPRPLDARAVAHRARMLEHLRSQAR
jgi:hypothetical protein